ncbi:hypothetical protein OE88DRAFT_1410086 [Heliocybe sulcata]|uniref:F-box domain-containing protein n=1 Tax=Heliocybe sulcata TaxID=5364 RepID=A0A5C3N5F2_9AGAM|nr:hypothetical protein OE88DRAFT_1410086 [Heliocybe sulcata]
MAPSTQNFVSLSDDLIDCILMFLPDFSSLFSFILASKRIYDIFDRHPISILQPIIQEEIGPAFPQALRLVRVAADMRSRNPDHWPSERVVVDNPVTLREAACLARNASTIGQLEDIFSRSNKDFYSSSPKSVLSASESKQFHVAAYRFWLYAKAFRPEYDLQGMLLEDCIRFRSTFFQHLVDAELREFTCFVQFLADVVLWVGTATGRVFCAPAG